MRPLGARARWLVLAIGLAVAWVRPVAAQSADRWLLVPVVTGGKLPEGGAVTAVTRGIESELRDAGYAVIANDAAAGAFESRHSASPVQLGSDQVRRLSKSIAQTARHLALGDLADAQRAMAGVDALSEPARDFLNRDAARARKIYDNCLMAAYLRERANEHALALRRMLECSRAFPSLRPEGRAYPAEVGRLFEEAKQQLNPDRSKALRVTSEGRSGCNVRLNGVEVGKTPLELAEVRATTIRVQVECEPGSPGRIHPRELAPGDNTVSIDPRFDATVQTLGGLWLSYPTDVERDARAARDLKAVGEAAGVKHVIALWISPGAVGQDVAARPLVGVTLREVARTSYAADSGYARGGASKLASALVAWASAQPGGPGPAAGSIAKSDVEPGTSPLRAANAVGPAPPSQPSAAGPEPRRRYTQQHAAAGAILAVIGGAGTAVGWVMYTERQSERTVIGEASDETAYRKLGVVALSTAGVGTTLLSLSEYFWLPDDPAIPSLAWVAGGVGLALGVSAVALSFTVSDCKIGDDRVSCQSYAADHFFGPLLFMHALPLLTVPLWYGLRSAFRPAHVQVAFATDPGGMPQLRLSGAF